jgi:transcriptional regulator with XRE-family HTH domain
VSRPETEKSLRELFASNVRVIRQQRGLSQEALASLAGLHRTYMGAVERGERNVSIDNIERIASALNLEAFKLLQTTR